MNEGEESRIGRNTNARSVPVVKHGRTVNSLFLHRVNRIDFHHQTCHLQRPLNRLDISQLSIHTLTHSCLLPFLVKVPFTAKCNLQLVLYMCVCVCCWWEDGLMFVNLPLFVWASTKSGYHMNVPKCQMHPFHVQITNLKVTVQQLGSRKSEECPAR